MFLNWNTIYSVNIKEFDSQHKKLFEIINNIYRLKQDPEKVGLIKAVNELEEYANYHLKREEEVFEEYNYPEKENHLIFHEKYREKISEFKEKIENEDDLDKLIKELSLFLKDWWIKHIQNIDHQYTDFLNKKGLY